MAETQAKPGTVQTAGNRRWRGVARRLALLGGTLVFLVGVLEVGVRWLTDTTPPLTEKDAAIGQRYLQSYADDVWVDEAQRKVALRFNEVGFRGPDRPREKPAGVRRIAVLGDSMIASLAVDEEKTCVARLEALLNQSHSDRTWEVMNFGVNGACPGQEMVLYRELVSQFRPDLVICAFFVGNDLADNCSRLSNNPRIYFDVDAEGNLQQEPFSAKRTAVSQWLNRYSRLYVWQRVALNRARHAVNDRVGVVEPGQWIFCSKETPDVAHAWKITGKIFEAFRREVESRGSRFAVVILPSGLQVCKDEFAKTAERAGSQAADFDADYPERRVTELCRAAGVPCFSLLADFRKAAPSASAKATDEWLFCNGTGHFNERGDALAAEAIHRFLTKEKAPSESGTPLVDSLR